MLLLYLYDQSFSTFYKGTVIKNVLSTHIYPELEKILLLQQQLLDTLFHTGSDDSLGSSYFLLTV